MDQPQQRSHLIYNCIAFERLDPFLGSCQDGESSESIMTRPCQESRLAAKGVLNFQFYEMKLRLRQVFIYLCYKDASFASLELRSEECNTKLYRFPF